MGGAGEHLLLADMRGLLSESGLFRPVAEISSLGTAFGVIEGSGRFSSREEGISDAEDRSKNFLISDPPDDPCLD